MRACRAAFARADQRLAKRCLPLYAKLIEILRAGERAWRGRRARLRILGSEEGQEERGDENPHRRAGIIRTNPGSAYTLP